MMMMRRCRLMGATLGTTYYEGCLNPTQLNAAVAASNTGTPSNGNVCSSTLSGAAGLQCGWLWLMIAAVLLLLLA